LVVFRIGLDFPADLQHCLAADPNFAGYFGTRVAFDDPTQQQHRLGRTEISPFKDRPAIKIVNPLAQSTSVDCQLAGFGLSKLAGLVQALTAMGTLQALPMKVFEQPLAAEFIIQ
jgi:hypothetical protein